VVAVALAEKSEAFNEVSNKLLVKVRWLYMTYNLDKVCLEFMQK